MAVLTSSSKVSDMATSFAEEYEACAGWSTGTKALSVLRVIQRLTA